MPVTHGINHLGLSVRDLKASTRFFVEYLGWEESGYDPGYPRTAVSDGVTRLTLWEVDKSLEVVEFDRRKNIGLHHVAFHINSESELNELFCSLADKNDVTIEFAPELVGNGPRKHFMVADPSGLRVEFIWQG